jgi:hypothetical protein
VDPEHGGAVAVTMSPHDRLTVEATLAHAWGMAGITPPIGGTSNGTTIGIGCTISML